MLFLLKLLLVIGVVVAGVFGVAACGVEVLLLFKFAFDESKLILAYAIPVCYKLPSSLYKELVEFDTLELCQA